MESFSPDEAWRKIPALAIPSSLKPTTSLMDDLASASSMVDFGCGPNPSFGLRNPTYIGCDVNFDALVSARQFGASNLIQCDAERMPIKTASRDLGFAQALLTCIPDRGKQERVIREIARVLRPGAKLYIADFLRVDDHPHYGRLYSPGGLVPATVTGSSSPLYYAKHFRREEIRELVRQWFRTDRWLERQVTTRSGRRTTGFECVLVRRAC